MITAAALINVVKGLVKKNPDFVYTNPNGMCKYFPTKEQPGCIFGQALLELGLPGETLKELEGNAIGTVLEKLNIKTTEKQHKWVSCMQEEQDSKRPWREAMKLAEVSDINGRAYL